jgi:hypothetical protein
MAMTVSKIYDECIPVTHRLEVSHLPRHVAVGFNSAQRLRHVPGLATSLCLAGYRGRCRNSSATTCTPPDGSEGVNRSKRCLDSVCER